MAKEIKYFFYPVNFSRSATVRFLVGKHGKDAFYKMILFMEFLSINDNSFSVEDELLMFAAKDAMGFRTIESAKKFIELLLTTDEFVSEGGEIFSNTLRISFDKLHGESEKNSNNAKAGWIKRKKMRPQCDGNAQAKHTQCDGNTNRIEENRQEKKRPEKNIREESEIIALLDAYHKILPMLPKTKLINAEIKKNAAELLKEVKPEAIIETFKMVPKCNHLIGKNDRGWQATFGWLMKPVNYAKVVNGNYLKSDKLPDVKPDAYNAQLNFLMNSVKKDYENERMATNNEQTGAEENFYDHIVYGPESQICNR